MSLVLLLFLALSCAVKEPCKVSFLDLAGRPPPESFRAYGYITTPYGRHPFLLKKREGNYSLKVGRVRGLELKHKSICYFERCYLLPESVEDIIFTHFLRRAEVIGCDREYVYLKAGEETFYAKSLRGGLKILYPDSEVTLTLLDRVKEGYFRRLFITTPNVRFNIFIEKLTTQP